MTGVMMGRTPHRLGAVHDRNQPGPVPEGEEANVMTDTEIGTDRGFTGDDKPAKLARLDGKTWKYAGRRALAEFGKDGGTDLAATLTYYTVLSIAPAMLAVFSIFSLVLGSYREQISASLEDVLSRVDLQETYKTLIRDTVDQILGNAGGGGASIALVVSILLAIWSASAYVKAFSRVMNTVYGIAEGRTFVRQTATMVLATVALLVAAVLILASLVVSPAVLGPILNLIAEPLGLAAAADFLLESFLPIWNWVKWPVILALMVLAIALLYHLAPNVDKQRFKVLSVGAVFAIVGMAVAGVAMFVYITQFASYSSYGAIGTVMAVLFVLWVMNLVLVMGAEVDAEVERARELQAGIAAEEAVQLPPRDTTAAEKAAEKEQKLVDDGRDLRLAPLHDETTEDR
jgi:membrane protein